MQSKEELLKRLYNAKQKWLYWKKIGIKETEMYYHGIFNGIRLALADDMPKKGK